MARFLKSTAEIQTVELTLGGETRQVEIKRDSPNHCWFAECFVIVKFRSGTKRHRLYRPQVVDRYGSWGFVNMPLRGKRCYPIAWDSPAETGSGWNGYRKEN